MSKSSVQKYTYRKAVTFIEYMFNANIQLFCANKEVEPCLK